jgi:predicted small metal-binding protein
MDYGTEARNFFSNRERNFFSSCGFIPRPKSSAILAPRRDRGKYGGISMAKVLHCNDVVPDCDYVAKGDSEQDVMQQAAEHARIAHNVGEVTPELADKVRSAIRDEAA